jgi:hypothetical protein
MNIDNTKYYPTHEFIQFKESFPPNTSSNDTFAYIDSSGVNSDHTNLDMRLISKSNSGFLLNASESDIVKFNDTTSKIDSRDNIWNALSFDFRLTTSDIINSNSRDRTDKPVISSETLLGAIVLNTRLPLSTTKELLKIKSDIIKSDRESFRTLIDSEIAAFKKKCGLLFFKHEFKIFVSICCTYSDYDVLSEKIRYKNGRAKITKLEKVLRSLICFLTIASKYIWQEPNELECVLCNCEHSVREFRQNLSYMFEEPRTVKYQKICMRLLVEDVVHDPSFWLLYISPDIMPSIQFKRYQSLMCKYLIG